MKKIFSRKWLFFSSFTAVFAVLAAFVFWGTWSPDVAPVMPDDAIWHPVAFSDQFGNWFRGWLSSGVFSPVNVFWDGIAISKYWTQELKYVSGLFISSLGLAFFLRGRGRSRLASYGAGLLLAFCGYWMTLFSAGHGGWFVIMGPMVLAFAFMDRVASFGRIHDGILLGACVGWGTCHQPDLFLLFAEFLALFGAYACVRERRFPWKAAAAALVFFAVIGAPGVYSAFSGALASRDKQIAESAGTAMAGGKGTVAANASDAEKKKADDEARWVFATNWSMPPEDTLEFFIPRIHGDTCCPMTLQLARAAGKDVTPYTGRLGRPLNAPAGCYRQHSLYVGWVTCLLALLGVVVGLLGLRKSSHLSAPSSKLSALSSQLSALSSQLPAPSSKLSAPSSKLSAPSSQLSALSSQLPSSDLLFFAVAALLFWLFSMGRFCEPVYRLVYALPFGDYLRGPVKWHHLTEFCLCVLAGYGIDALFGFLRERGLGEKMAYAVTALVVLFGAADLARVDRLYCAPIDITAVRSRNPAAEMVKANGGGSVVDLVERGNGLLAWSFMAHGVGISADLNAPGVRFVWTTLEVVQRNPQFAAWLKARAEPVGFYAVTQKGIRTVAPNMANVALYRVKDVPPPPKPAPVPLPVRGGVLTLGVISLAGTIAALAFLAALIVRGTREGT